MGIVDAVSECCRNRSVTHALMSPLTYYRYVGGLTQRHRRSGIKAATCHGVSLLIIDGMTDEVIYAFNHRRAKASRDVLHAARLENYEEVLDLLQDLLDSKMEGKAKWLHACVLPEEDDDETA